MDGKRTLEIRGHTSTLSFPPVSRERLRVFKSRGVLKKMSAFIPLTFEEDGDEKLDTEAFLFKESGETYETLTGLLSLWGNDWVGVTMRRDSERSITPRGIPESFRDYQKVAALSAIEKRRCSIEIGTGGGKSWLAWYWSMSAIESGERALITVPSINLLSQMRDDILTCVEDFGGVVPKIGLLGGGHEDTDCDLLIAIPNSLWSRREDESLTEFLRSIFLWVGDEQHKLCNPTGCYISSLLSGARYRIGMTATPLPPSSGGLLLEGMFGRKLLAVSAKSLIESNVILRPQINIYRSPMKAALANLLSKPRKELGGLTGTALLESAYAHYKYTRLYEWLIVQNEERNALIAQLARAYMDEAENDGYPMLIILQRVDKEPSHARLILSHLGEGYELPILTGSTPKGELNEKLKALKEGKLKGAIAGPTLLQEGTNIPLLGSVILGMGGRSSVGLIQKVGRAVRYVEGKKEPTIVDFYDDISYFRGQSEERLNIYRRTYGENSVSIEGAE